MAFLTTNAFLGSMKLENYVDYYLPDDFTIYTYSGDENTTVEQKKVNNAASEKLAENIKNIDGITNVQINRSTVGILAFDEDLFRPFMESEFSDPDEYKEAVELYQDNYFVPVIAVDTEMMNMYNKKAKKKIDIDRFEKGEICFIGYVNSEEDSEYMTGKTIQVTDKDSGKSLPLEIGVCPTYDDYHELNIGYYWQLAGAPSCIIVSQNAIDKLTDSPSIDGIIANCDPKAESSVKNQIKALTDVCISTSYVSVKSDEIASFKSSMNGMNILTAGISTVLILIGVINFINVMLTGVYTRRNELAVMESVGMTKKQIRKMLMYEGFYYGGITIGLIATFGNGIVYLVAKLAQQITDYAVFNYPWKLMIGIAAVILLICVIVPALVYRTLAKETVTERLRISD
jgi:putative ABC transport system permease protein